MSWIAAIEARLQGTPGLAAVEAAGGLDDVARLQRAVAPTAWVVPAGTRFQDFREMTGRLVQPASGRALIVILLRRPGSGNTDTRQEVLEAAIVDRLHGWCPLPGFEPIRLIETRRIEARDDAGFTWFGIEIETDWMQEAA